LEVGKRRFVAKLRIAEQGRKGSGGKRGIAFIGGEGPSAARCRELVNEAGRADTAGVVSGAADTASALSGAVTTNAPIIVAADSGLIAAEAAGITVDWVIGDMDSLDDVRRLDKYPADRVLRYGHDKDYTDTELALALLRDQGCGETWLIGGGGGRTDHLLAIRSLFERERPPARWVTAREDIRCLREGGVFSIKRGGEGGSREPAGAGPV
jgi:thiamine pyrophosphokinase